MPNSDWGTYTAKTPDFWQSWGDMGGVLSAPEERIGDLQNFALMWELLPWLAPDAQRAAVQELMIKANQIGSQYIPESVWQDLTAPVTPDPVANALPPNAAAWLDKNRNVQPLSLTQLPSYAEFLSGKLQGAKAGGGPLSELGNWETGIAPWLQSISGMAWKPQTRGQWKTWEEEQNRLVNQASNQPWQNLAATFMAPSTSLPPATGDLGRSYRGGYWKAGS